MQVEALPIHAFKLYQDQAVIEQYTYAANASSVLYDGGSQCGA